MSKAPKKPRAKKPKVKSIVGPPSVVLPYGLAIDPGSEHSGWVYFETMKTALGGLQLLKTGNETPNLELVRSFREQFNPQQTRLIIETPRPRGILTSADEMETLVWIGQFIREWSRCGGRWTFMFRTDVTVHLTGLANTKDPNVKLALLDRFGGEKRAVGGKKCEQCHGKKTYGVTTVVCEECRGSKVVPGAKAGTTKKCAKCQGRGVVRGAPAKCPSCCGSGWKYPPGPLAEVTKHAWQALGLAALWVDKPVLRQRIVGS